MKRFFKILLRILAFFMLLLVIFSVVFSFSSVQTKLANKLTSYVNETYKTDINIEKIDLSYVGRVKLKNVLIKDPRADTIIYAKDIRTSLLSFNKIIKNKVELSDVYLTDVAVKMIMYKGEEEYELKKFIENFQKNKDDDREPDFLLTSKKVVISKGVYIHIDENKQPEPVVAYRDIYGKVIDFKLEGSHIYGKVRNMQTIDLNNLVVTNMNTDFSYSRTKMEYLNCYLQTPSSEIKADIIMNYQDGDLSDFIEKVQIEATISKADISLKDMKGFYNELGTKDIVHFTTQVKGTLNDFHLYDLKMQSDQKAVMMGDLHLVNSFHSKENFQLNASISHLESDRAHLIKLLPNLLGKTLPDSFDLLGHFSLKGNSFITKKKIVANLFIQSKIGAIQSDLKITNIDNINQASYIGNISLQDIKLGELIGDPLVGSFSMDADIDGKGFTLEKLDTKINGNVTKHQYKGYTYRNIDVEGKVKDKLFFGKIKANDPNIKFNFQGLADLSQEKYKLVFTAHVDHAEFNKLNLFKRDSVSVLKGDIKIAMLGNQLENMVGFIKFKNATYKNQLQDYHFKDFTVISAVKDSIQTLKINSTDIVDGQIKGRFVYKELGKLAQNAFGSIYTNYQSFEVSPKQYLDFRFKIYNHVVAVFFPDIQLGANTSIKGKINSDQKLFNLTLKSPEILAYNNYIEKIRLRIDNKSPLFNTQLSADRIKTKMYSFADIDLVNITLNDTLRFRTEFKGGEKLQDNFNFSFYHTINKNNQSIIGFKKSEININNTQWFLNPNEDDEKNVIVINNETKEINYHDFSLTSLGQTLLFNGVQKGNDNQKFNIDLDRINLSQIIPDIEKFKLDGLINGGIWIEKRNDMFIPTADIQLLDFKVNNVLQGDLIGEIYGTKTKKNYEIDFFLEKDNDKNITAKGSLDLNSKKPQIDLDISFNNFKIDILNAIAQGVMENIHGTLSGETKIQGFVSNPDFSGEVTLQNTGVYFPYINVDYTVAENSKVSLNNQSFIINDAIVFDSLHRTSATLSGNITHNYFKQWFLDLQIETENLLAINTKEEENALFYGTGFLKGTASFTGDTDNVNIIINGSSNPGTKIVVPMSDLETVETSSLIHFVVPEEEKKESKSSLLEQISERFNGVTMDFNLDITKDAELQIVIDQSTGSSLQGNGKGAIQMDIDTKGTFNMYGNYIVDEGLYNFKYGALINKPFKVEKGGSITFTGDPYKAELNIDAVYTTKANPEAILSEYEGTRRIPVELSTKLTGELFNSKQAFDISIPNADIDLSSELDFVLNDKDTGNMMIQFVSLIVTGSFYNQDKDLLTNGSSVGNETITSAATLVSNALLDIFSDPEDKIQFGFDYIQGNKLNATENQLGVSMATRLGKNEKIIINGEVNVPTDNQSNANIAGNVSVELPMNKKENLLMKVFNRQNQIQYEVQEEGYTQGVGFSWQLNYDKKKKTKKELKTKDSVKSNSE